jgi:hypothetical protein
MRTGSSSARAAALRSLFILTALTFLTPTIARAVLIDFVTTPAGVAPADDANLPFLLPYTNTPGVAVTFGFDADSNGVVETNAVFEAAGPDLPDGGFSGSNGQDTADPGFTAQLGNYFLRGQVGGAPFGTFVIKYVSTTGPVTACSGEIWDIDGTNDPGGTQGATEQYLVKAFDSSNNLLGSQLSPLGTLLTPFAPLDGQPWTFTFSGLTAGLDHIEITFVGTKTAGIGLAFNNFDPTAVPEPGMVGLIGAASATMLLARARRNARR